MMLRCDSTTARGNSQTTVSDHVSAPLHRLAVDSFLDTPGVVGPRHPGSKPMSTQEPGVVNPITSVNDTPIASPPADSTVVRITVNRHFTRPQRTNPQSVAAGHHRNATLELT